METESYVHPSTPVETEPICDVISTENAIVDADQGDQEKGSDPADGLLAGLTYIPL